MTREDKELLLKDLCARLPYGVMIQIPELFYPQRKVIEKLVTIDDLWYFNDSGIYIENVKPYLRPMSSMTEEEMKELKTLCSIYIPTDSPIIGFEEYGIVVFTHHLTNNTYSFKLNISVIDWLNKKMFDYRGLIEKDLAIEATKGMYNLNN